MFFLKLPSLMQGLQKMCRACKWVWFLCVMWPVPVISNAVTDICDSVRSVRQCAASNSRLETLGPVWAAVEGRRNYVAEVEGRWRLETWAPGSPAGNHSPSISWHFLKDKFYPKISRQLLRVAFTHFLFSNPPECQGWGRGVESILAMPWFWVLLLQPPLPYCTSCDSFTLALCAFKNRALRPHTFHQIH